MTVQLGYTGGVLWMAIAMSFAVQTCWFAKKTEACSKIVVISELLSNVSTCTCTGNCSCASAFNSLCVYNVHSDGTHNTGCSKCNPEFTFKKYKEKYHIILTENKSLSQSPNISLWILRNWTCKPSSSDNNNLLLSDSRNRTDIDLSLCGHESGYDKLMCTEMNITSGFFILSVDLNNENKCVTCTNPVKEPELTVPLGGSSDLVNDDGSVNPSKANEIMESLPSVVDKMGNASFATVVVGNVKGAALRLKEKKPFYVAYSAETKGMVLVSNPNALKEAYHWGVNIPTEAVNLSQSENGGEGFAGILHFTNMPTDDKKSRLLNNEVFGISMSANISHLKNKISIRFNNVSQDLALLRCNSWRGVGSRPNWTEDGCKTVKGNRTVICNCSHLTFFAILLSATQQQQPNGTISTADLNSLTYISYIGCGLSMFFLGVALFIHYLLRKAKSSQSIQILMNLFTALFFLNLTFLSNEWVANTGSFLGCIIIAALMHYFMLTTFTWFALQALHLYLRLIKMSNTKSNKSYIVKMCIPAWVCPAVVVITIAALGKYHLIIITTTSYQAKMCWMTDTVVHYVVNIGYYAVVFVFTLGIFVVVVHRILMTRRLKVKDAKTPSTSKNLMAIMSLLALLGLTWGVAFFSYGPMVIPSYYIFCILNAFQGFFLFIYYYKNSKELNEDLNSENPFKSSTSSNTATSNTYVTNG